MLENKELIKIWNNDNNRKAFLNAYKEWGLWCNTPEVELDYYRYILPDGTAIIAMEHNHRAYSYEKDYYWDKSVTYYIQKPDSPFTPDNHRTISMVADLLKEAKVKLQK